MGHCKGLHIPQVLVFAATGADRVLRRRKRGAGGGWAGQLAAPLALGGAELLPALAKLGGALTVCGPELLTFWPCNNDVFLVTNLTPVMHVRACRGSAWLHKGRF